MKYREVKPVSALARFINCFWLYEGDEKTDIIDYTFPDGSPEIIFHTETNVYRSNSEKNYFLNPENEVIGQLSMPYQIKIKGKNRFFGIRFFPHTFSVFTEVPLYELTDKVISADHIFGKEIESINEIFQQEKCINTVVSNVQHILLKKVNTRRLDSKYEVLEYSVRKMFEQASSDTLLNDIILKTGTNARFIQRLFNDRVGISLRLLMKVIRFQKTFKYLQNYKGSLSDIAYTCGYSDQSHFIRDFKRFSGTTPSMYVAENYPINQNFLSEQSIAYLYNLP